MDIGKTNLDKFFKVDEKIQEEGVDFEIGDACFRVRQFSGNNPRFKAAMAKYYKPYARQIEMGSLDQKKSLALNVQIFLDVCLVSWRGVEADGKPLEFSRENALAFFERLPELFDVLWKHANDFVNYKEDLGNS